MSLENMWNQFQQRFNLSDKQMDQFRWYAQELLDWNKKFNLTALLDMEKVITLHFEDSLALSLATDMSKVTTIADVGTGAGFPIIPLKIAFPHIHTILIEVSLKRVSFLEHVAKSLDLENVEVYPFDWRMFLRKTSYDVDMVIARASLQPEELVRMFKPSSHYKEAVLVYWASDTWQVNKQLMPYLHEEKEYEVAGKQRKLVFFGQPTNE